MKGTFCILALQQSLTINSSKKNELIIGSQDGHIVLLKLNGDYEVLQTATYNTGHMTCKSQWLNENSFIARF